MSDLFSYVNNINSGGENMMRGTENDQLAEKLFVPWTTNIAFALYPDTIFQANEMNLNSHLPSRAVYEFYKAAVRPRKRYAKWVKSSKDEDLDAVCSYYQCNRTVGAEYLSLLNRHQVNAIKQRQVKGGKK